MKLPGLPRLSDASRTVLVMLLGIAFLELGISKRFGQIWMLAFTPTPATEPANAQHETTQAQPGPGLTGQPPIIPM